MAGLQYQVADEGDQVFLSFTFRNTSGALANPTTVTFAQRTPNQIETAGTTTTTGWTNPTTGTYTRFVPVNIAGLWQFEARGAGNQTDQVLTVAVDVQRSRVRV